MSGCSYCALKISPNKDLHVYFQQGFFSFVLFLSKKKKSPNQPQMSPSLGVIPPSYPMLVTAIKRGL